MNSHNHIMFGTVDIWFYRNLGGVRVIKPGFEEVEIRPDQVELKFVAVSLNTVRGPLRVEVERGVSTRMRVSVPVGTSAKVYVPIPGPNAVVREGKTVIWAEGRAKESPEGIKGIRLQDRYLEVEVGSGDFDFSAK